MLNSNIKIVMTLLVRNEEDIIRENIEFHLSQGVSFFIATYDTKRIQKELVRGQIKEDSRLLEYLSELPGLQRR